MENKLKEIFNTVNDLLKFGEAKNAGLVVFNSGVIVAIIGQLKDLGDMRVYVIVGMLVLVILNLISLVIAFFSILAKTSNEINLSENVDTNANLIFFLHLAKMNEAKLLETLNLKYGLQIDNEAINRDIANQIIVNARITVRKFQLFNYGTKITLTGIIVAALIILVGFCFTGSVMAPSCPNL